MLQLEQLACDALPARFSGCDAHPAARSTASLCEPEFALYVRGELQRQKYPAELARARAIVLASRKTGLRTIAEFVESGDTSAKLREIGVDYAQGFSIGKPGPMAQVS